MTAVSAKGTRLNRRGQQTRAQMIEVAIDCLATARADEPVSANLVAKRSGVTWGTVQHQFGDVDGLWEAVLYRILQRWQPVDPVGDPSSTVAQRIESIVDRIWRAMGAPEGRAVEKLRTMLPSDHDELAAIYPLTSAAIAEWDRAWTSAYQGAFDGLDVDAGRLRRVRIFLPGALRGIRSESEMLNYADIDEGRRGLVEAIVAYLDGSGHS
ncbi:TetR/AcrR family transcriptional regulator [Gordonia rhizosphera]|uniref:HTH tetR-type domain-containing protein n=1 Tax=Gordonia rhizosphera NBRC 16068 TaxID=1108045 RepID=K6W0I0_9ACTN|nr:TetR/AcrR family transcriptional regulator [Gordonia rhizosphera]GAB92675.1 hypothetical protein GORHZ_186_00460 [Gordonia rhizosphera NBRC 16068]